MLTDLPYQLLF